MTTHSVSAAALFAVTSTALAMLIDGAVMSGVGEQEAGSISGAGSFLTLEHHLGHPT